MIRGVRDPSRLISRTVAWKLPFWTALVAVVRASALACALAILAIRGDALAQISSSPPKTLPLTTIAPADEEPAGPSESDAEPSPALPPSVPKNRSSAAQHRKIARPVDHKAAPPYAGPIETVQARMMIKQDTWAYAAPAKSSRQLEQLRADQFVSVTGLTRYFARTKLKDGQVAYVLLSDLELSRPTDKIFQLTRDTPVLSQPSHFGQKLAEVHSGHDVHVIGSSMTYMKIRMRDGLEGYITASALE